MSERNPRLLIGSSTEGLRFAEELQKLVSPNIEALLWNQGLFLPGEYALESLQVQSKKFDGAVIVATADDKVISRGKEQAAPRDNLLFEFGMFIAVFGRRRALLIVEGIDKTKLPSDLNGLNVIPFIATEPLAAGLGPVATDVKKVAESWRSEPYDPAISKKVERILGVGLAEIQDRTGIGGELGMHAFLMDERLIPPQLVRIARARTSPKAPLQWSGFQQGIGVVGTCWSYSSAVFVNFEKDGLTTIDQGEWERRGPLQRWGMDYEMFDKSRRRYKCVGAVPIATINGFLGCVSYNLGVASASSASALESPAVTRVLDMCAELISVVLG